MEPESVHTVVTSPPYWGLRDYGAEGQLGLESTPEAYVESMVAVFREVRRVLRSDGTVWLNLGDSYVTTSGALGTRPAQGLGAGRTGTHDGAKPSGTMKPKDLVGIPWRVAFALQADGWVLRSEIVWSKPNPMPESVTDRPTKSHEQMFLFSKAKWVGPARGRFADISDSDARWLAMFLDTEGSIVVKRVQRGERRWYGSQIVFSSTSRALLETARSIVGQGTILERPGTNAPMFYYQLSNRAARDLLHRTYPYIIVKPVQAAIGIALQDRLSTSGKKRPGGFRASADDAWLERAWETNKSLNHFGTPDISWVPAPAYGKWDSQPYYYDADAVREANSNPDLAEQPHDWRNRPGNGEWPSGTGGRMGSVTSGRNLRSVWTIATQPYPGAHFATFPQALVEPCIKAGCPEGGTVLDPFAGSGTTGLVAQRLSRRAVLIDLNADYLGQVMERNRDIPLGLSTPEEAA
jgi:DNA modification methylase